MRVVAIVGAVLIGLGLIGLLESFARFALEGRGTPSPILPTRHLIVSGFYRYVRNPMYLSVVALIVGQGLLLGQISLLLYGACIWLMFHIFVLTYEEPTLRNAFPEDYEAFFSDVPRWRPRMHPWSPAAKLS
jgi:protein-S-isoprenylcysteine O-methyltransferase Ste14